MHVIHADLSHVDFFFWQAKRVAEVLELVGEMLDAGVKPNAVAVNSVLAACARDPGDYWMHAKTIFEVCLLRF